MMKRWVFTLALFLGLIPLSGCGIFAPFIQAWKNVGASEDDRKALLGPEIKKFGEALYWGKGEAVLFLDPEAPAALRKELAKRRDDMRIVETKIDAVEYSDGAQKADVELLVRYYRVPFYIVTDSIEKQEWRFEVGGRWRLRSRELQEEARR